MLVNIDFTLTWSKFHWQAIDPVERSRRANLITLKCPLENLHSGSLCTCGTQKLLIDSYIIISWSNTRQSLGQALKIRDSRQLYVWCLWFLEPATGPAKLQGPQGRGPDIRDILKESSLRLFDFLNGWLAVGSSRPRSPFSSLQVTTF